LDRLEENIGSVNIEFAADELRDINKGSSEIKVEGTRYPAVTKGGSQVIWEDKF
jgi:hypothetical protein